MVGLLTLTGLALPDTSLLAIWPVPPAQQLDAYLLRTHALLILAVLVVGLLLYAGLNQYLAVLSGPASEGSRLSASNQPDRRPAVALLVLSGLVLAKMLHNLYWLSLWDKTHNGLEWLWLVLPVMAAMLVAVLLAVGLPDRARLVGSAYCLLMPVLLIALFASARQVDNRQLTAERAGQVSQAIERYYEQEGHYPTTLAQLTGWSRRTLPRPLIIYSQQWCYDGGHDDGNDYYRLGYLDRLHWSDPRLIGQTHELVGELPELDPVCQAEFAAVTAHNTGFPCSYWAGE
jgi:type II secretory pathway pseudopilin PulG